MTISTTRRALAAGTALAAALTLGACGGSGTATKESASAGAAGADAKVGDTVPLAELSKDMTAALKKAGTVKTKADMGGEGGAMVGEISYKGSSPAMHMTMTGGAAGDSEIILLDKTMYMSGESMKALSNGKKWVKISADGDDMMSKMVGPMLNQMDSLSDPSATYSKLSGVNSTVTKVEGDNVTYETKISGEQLKQLAQDQLKQMASGAATSIPTDSIPSMSPMTITQVVDKEGRPTNVTMTGGTSATEKMTMTYSDYGADFEVTAPPAAEVGQLEMPALPSASS
ncbi:MAG: hypothetical protein LWW86_03155 [Micrococcales bacterium]|nr:hypothetical protein [Micrococcales bacterium]